MSDQYNLAGKSLIVDDVQTTSGRVVLPSMLSASLKVGNHKLALSLCSIGAKNNGSTVEIFAFNPKKAYSSNYDDDYYVHTGYIKCSGKSIPVTVSSKHKTYIPNQYGSWAIVALKENETDETYVPQILFPHPVTTDGVTTMVWSRPDGTALTSLLDVWVIGRFVFTDISVENLYISDEGSLPSGFLKSNFMQIMNDAEGEVTEDFTNWAVAMGVDQIFRRLAMLEAFIGDLTVSRLHVGNGDDLAGFKMDILNGDPKKNIPPTIVAKWNGMELWMIDPTNGKMYGNFARVRQYIPFQFDDSVDSTHPLECQLYVPENAEIVSIKMCTKHSKYRAYSKSVAYTPDDWSDLNIPFTGSGTGTVTAGLVNVVVSGTGIKNLKHSHDMEFGIYEGTAPSNVAISFMDGLEYGDPVSLGGEVTDYDITQHITGTGWKKFKLTSSTLGRIQVQIIAELLVTT